MSTPHLNLNILPHCYLLQRSWTSGSAKHNLIFVIKKLKKRLSKTQICASKTNFTVFTFRWETFDYVNLKWMLNYFILQNQSKGNSLCNFFFRKENTLFKSYQKKIINTYLFQHELTCSKPTMKADLRLYAIFYL